MSGPWIEKRHMVGFPRYYDPAYGFVEAFSTVLDNLDAERAVYNDESWFRFVFGNWFIPAPHTPRQRFPLNYIIWIPFGFYGPFY